MTIACWELSQGHRSRSKVNAKMCVLDTYLPWRPTSTVCDSRSSRFPLRHRELRGAAKASDSS